MYELCQIAGKLSLVPTTNLKIKPITVDFCSPKLLYRCQPNKLTNEAIIKALGIKKYQMPVSVIDATAGLGNDAFILAAYGCNVQLIERSNIIAQLLKDGLTRASACNESAKIVQNMQLITADALEFLTTLSPPQYPDLIYLDPMFPKSHKAAAAKKEMQALRQIVGADTDSSQLALLAISLAKKRVVVKRPRLAPCLTAFSPSFMLNGAANRFDVYLK